MKVETKQWKKAIPGFREMSGTDKARHIPTKIPTYSRGWKKMPDLKLNRHFASVATNLPFNV